MTNASDGDDSNEPRGGRPGPADHGHHGGMATRENVPELAEDDENDHD